MITNFLQCCVDVPAADELLDIPSSFLGICIMFFKCTSIQIIYICMMVMFCMFMYIWLHYTQCLFYHRRLCP